jgi:hypothetical protein
LHILWTITRWRAQDKLGPQAGDAHKSWTSARDDREQILGALHLLRERKHDVSFWDFFVSVARRMLSVNAAAAA